MAHRRWRWLLCAALACSLCLPVSAAPSQEDAQDHGMDLSLTWAQEEGILLGTGPDQLTPNGEATRAMAVTVLHRYAGTPQANSSHPFSDVPAEAYYADAVTWAVETGLTNGKTAETFCPNDPISRQEFATLLYRLCVDRDGVPEQVGENNITTIADFTDHQAVAPYALPAMTWAVGDLFLTGETNENGERLLQPQASILRGEMTQLLRQYDCLVEGNPAPLYRFAAEDVTQIQLRAGTGEVVTLTDPAEIARFLERVNAFTYTSQYNPEPAGGFYYFADITMRTGEVLQLELQPNELNHHILPPSSEQAFFSQEWLQSFYGTTT